MYFAIYMYLHFQVQVQILLHCGMHIIMYIQQNFIFNSYLRYINMYFSFLKQLEQVPPISQCLHSKVLWYVIANGVSHCTTFFVFLGVRKVFAAKYVASTVTKRWVPRSWLIFKRKPVPGTMISEEYAIPSTLTHGYHITSTSRV